ncbi:peptidase A4 family-domain-containing protein [Trametes polyzona]|nr:peptidase A4 family-domain-containing protein [Trametes polyzona]
MRPLTALTASLFLTALEALARPSTFADRALRRGRPFLPAPPLAGETPTPASKVAAAAAAHPTVRSSNWAGVVLPAPPPNENFTAISGTFTVPTLAPSPYAAASIWLGIDGWSTDASPAPGAGSGQGLFQAGVDCWVEGAALTYNAWYEWVPDSSWNFTDFAIAAGDVLAFRLVATSDRRGTIDIENETTGQKVSHVLDAPPSPPFSNPQLSLQTVEWIVEDFYWYGQVPFADFGSVTFKDASATTSSGKSVGLTDGTIIDLVLSNKVRTEVTIEGESTATVKYLPA